MAPNPEENQVYVTLDLDLLENIAHPYWEFLDPNPDIKELFERLRKLLPNNWFKEGELRVEWSELRSRDAGETRPRTKKEPLKILLNKKLLNSCLRRDTVETLAHEMIHAYLILNGMEKDDQHHCENFMIKAVDINELTNLNIAENHEYSNSKSHERFLWRCRNNCRRMPPYFGFVWLKEDREPDISNQMVSKNQCDHVFERISVDDNPKRSIPLWDCVCKFVNDTKDFVRVKTKLCKFTNEHEFLLAESMVDENSNRLVVPNSINHFSCGDECFVNFDKITKKLLPDHGLAEQFSFGESPFLIVCMICEKTVATNQIIKHLENCTGLGYELPIAETLPLCKIMNPEFAKSFTL